jgi:hypothetical protein
MASYYLAPVVHKTWFVPGGNTPASGGLLFTYVAGSSTKTTVYKDNAGGSSHTNPIVLDSGGNLPSGSEVWIPTGVTIDIVFAPSNDTDPPASPYDTLEDISGINDVNASVTDWITGPTPTFVSGTQFVLSGDQSANFKNGRRLRTTNTGGTVYSGITSVIAAAGSTTVNVISDAGATLDSGLSAVAYSLLDPQYSSINEYYVGRSGANVASAGNGTTDIWGVAGNHVHLTGTNTVYSFSSAAYTGAKRSLIFDGALTLASSAALLSSPSAPFTNVVTRAGDRAEVVASTSPHSVITQYQRGDGRALTQSMEFIASSVAASSATIDFVFSTAAVSSFPSYLLTISNMKIASDGQGLAIRVSEDGGSNFNASSTAYLYSAMWLDSDNSTVGAATTAAAGNMLASQVSNGIGNAAAEDYAGTVRFFAPNNTICHKRFVIDASHALPSGVSTRLMAHGTYVSTSAFNALRLLATSGNINSGKFVLYGLRDI